MSIQSTRRLNQEILELPASRFTNGQGGGAIVEGSYAVYRDLTGPGDDDWCGEGYFVPWCPNTW
ncbi:hypothetical protein E0H93_28485 [Rhizobium leguminosarum bv. viciae]|nr:hypothetical protein [Rhizobium leguminosarum bv. viciae]NKK96410.1 hypothetical protein [Rhizobium leguminosarum bv. viciae]TBY26917.1 hypothetical protein E0H55_28640 [Rhizobium leguminosarum bv. viciae]TBZ56038.1 hypothetical protein E0H64_36790 [Rhizobium leguminosarum bv. viciae]TCA02697.1 hypothetical protein E0H68_35515 [Rhizobium leguminosarum bv. viciae]